MVSGFHASIKTLCLQHENTWLKDGQTDVWKLKSRNAKKKYLEISLAAVIHKNKQCGRQ